MDKPVMYFAHDPLGNSEAQVVEYDPALLAEAERQGIIFIAVDAAGNRQIVSAADVKPPNDEAGSLMLVQPIYVDERMSAVVDVFDALEAVLCPEAEAADDHSATTKRKAAARTLTPAEIFRSKLAALREFVAGGDAE